MKPEGMRPTATIEGVVSEFWFVNPHSLMTIEVNGSSGTVTKCGGRVRRTVESQRSRVDRDHDHDQDRGARDCLAAISFSNATAPSRPQRPNASRSSKCSLSELRTVSRNSLRPHRSAPRRPPFNSRSIFSRTPDNTTHQHVAQPLTRQQDTEPALAS